MVPPRGRFEPDFRPRGGIISRRRRLDVEIVRRGLAPSRAAAQDLIGGGRVTVGGSVAAKPARLVDPADAVVVAARSAAYVSRAGEKLAAALDRFAVVVAGRRCLDAGASTGGFTDCLLQHGAGTVVAVDVGRHQLHERIRSDSRVEVFEQTNARNLMPGDIGGPVDVAVADLSFISLKTVAPALVDCLGVEGGVMVLLVKPQFEAGRVEASRARGVIRDAEIWRRTTQEVATALVSHGAAIMGVMPSPITGGDGNVEFLIHAVFGSDGGRGDGDVAELVDAAIAEVGP